MKILTQRVYDEKQEAGYRVLVDRLWPRGITKQDAKLDDWCKEIAPSTELRQWFHHEEGEWTEFRRRYVTELKGNRKTAEKLLTEAAQSKMPLILLYSVKDKEHNHAQILKDHLTSLMDGEEIPEAASSVCYAHEFDKPPSRKK